MKHPITTTISTNNNLDYLKLAIQSVRKNAYYKDMSIIIHAENCSDGTDEWLEKHGFDFKEIHYTQDKWAVDVDILIDDSPSKLKKFNERSVNYGKAICYKQPWNKHCQDSSMSIDRLSDIIGKVFG